MHRTYDIIVVGGGHAGIEAAWAASRMGASTALITMEIGAIGRLSCNPAIGGIGKGQMVREIDALGGLMGQAIDAAGIQFRMLNRRKGPAVWSPRAQADRDLYPQEVQARLVRCGGLELIEGLVDVLLTIEDASTADALEHQPGRRMQGIRLADGRELRAPIVILTTGTFLSGRMHCGERQTEGGRVGEQSSKGLSANLRDLGFELGRLKTGTPPRVHRDTVNTAQLEVQLGDQPPTPFSFMVDELTQPQVACWIAYTTPQAHALIRDNLHRAPMYTGQIHATGVRYCPSIEDKVVRFADKSRHQVFLEPEGYAHEWIYCNGLGTSLPQDVQAGVLQRIPGLEHARIMQWGYAVEYDTVPTHQIRYSLETKRVAGLFLAGQINGTSGYEEAAGQGLLAGINAVLKLRGQEALILRRDQAYIGVMIDDLIARPPSEPYRMFTSRAEHRLILRCDNADARLTPVGRGLGLVDDPRWDRFQSKAEAIARLESKLASVQHDGKPVLELLRRPDMGWQRVVDEVFGGAIAGVPHEVSEQVEIRARYSGYIERVSRELSRLNQMESCRIPADLDFERIAALRTEARQKLATVRPLTLGQASRLSGVTPADITVLWIALEARRRQPRNREAVPAHKSDN